MRLNTAPPVQSFPSKPAWKKALAWAERIWEESVLASRMDDALRGQRVARWIKNGVELDSRIYDEPEDYLVCDSTDQIQAMLGKEEPGFKAEAIFAWGRLGSRKAKQMDRRIGFFGKNGAGKPLLFSICLRHKLSEDSGQNPRENALGLEQFTRWMIEEKIVLVQQGGGQWAWWTGQSAKSIFTVPHLQKKVGRGQVSSVQFELAGHARNQVWEWRGKRDQELARRAVPSQKKRLSDLLPEDKIELAMEIENARIERQELAQEAGLSAKGKSADAPAPSNARRL